MKVLVIPDVHCRIFWKEAIKKADEFDKVIFLGDYVDPYSDESVEMEDPVIALENVIDTKLTLGDKCVLLLANHDCHYIWNDIERSSRYNKELAQGLREIYLNNLSLFKFAHTEDDVVFTHAGIRPLWRAVVLGCNTVKEAAEKIEKWEIKEDLDELIIRSLNYISPYRGWFTSDVGSCIWADIREHIKDVVVDHIVPEEYDMYQVFGHTRLNKVPIITSQWACLDCSKAFSLDTETHGIIEC